MQKPAGSEAEARPRRSVDSAALLQELAIVANESMSIPTTLYMALDVIGRHTGWASGTFWVRAGVLGEETTVQVWCNRWLYRTHPCPEPHHEDLFERLAAAGQPVVVEDLEDPRALPVQLPNTNGFSGYLALPVKVANEYDAVMEFYSVGPMRLDPVLDNALHQACTLLGLVIERGRAQYTLRVSERRFRAIFDQSYQFIGLMEPDGTLIEANETALDFAGVTLDEVVGRKFWDTVWWAHSESAREDVRQAVARAAVGEFVHYDVEVQGAGGRRLTIDFSIKPIRSLAGDVVLLIPEGRDISELKRTLEELRESERRLEEAQRIAHMGHWVYDVQTETLYWSEALYRVFGLRPDTTEQPREAFWARVHPEDRAHVRMSLQRAYDEKGHYEHRHRVITDDGETRYVYGAGGVQVNGDGEIVRIAGIIQDITEQRQLEQSLAQSLARLSSLHTMGQAVASTRDLRSVYDQVLSAARTLLGAEMIMLFLEDQGELVVQATIQDGDVPLLGQRIPANTGIAGEVWLTGRPVWLHGEECRRRRSHRLTASSGYDPQTIMAVPVRWQDQVLGVLEATDIRPDAFTVEDVETLQAVAVWTAIAIGKARQHDALERRVKENQVVASVSRQLSETLEPAAILQLVLDAVPQVAPRLDWTLIHLLQGRPERLQPAAAAGRELDYSEYIIAPGEGIVGQALQEGRVINVADMTHEPRALPFALQNGFRSLLVAPLTSRSRALGTLTLAAAEPGVFTHDDERLIMILAVQAGMALENAHLFDSQRRARTVAELQRERLRELTKRIVTAQEEERLRISRELHDEAGQALTSLKISLELLRNRLPDDPAAVSAQLDDLVSLADGTMEMLRTLAHDLRPPGLDTFGLNIALQGLCQDLAGRAGLVLDYSGTDVPELSTPVALALYRFVQEALTNAVKHASAGRIEVSLSQADSVVRLTVKDDGRGFVFDPDNLGSRQNGGIGLVSMHERVELLGGKLEIETAPGCGTKVAAAVPYGEALQSSDRAAGSDGENA